MKNDPYLLTIKRTSRRWLIAIAAFIVCCALLELDAHAQWIKNPSDLKGPYVDSEPFDLLILNEEGENATLKIQPLLRPPSAPFPTQGSINFDFFEDYGERLEVPFSSVAQYKTFNQILIEEANGWLNQKQFAKAFRNYLYVYDHGGRSDPQLVQSLRTCMFEDGLKNFRGQNFELALSIYEDIYQRDPNFKVGGINRPLAEIVMLCYDGIIQQQFDAADYIEVRTTLDTIVGKYGKEAKNLSDKWSAAFKKKSDDLLTKSKQFASQGLGREAHLAAKQADQMFPNRADVFEYQKELLRQFPFVLVGVSQGAADANPNRFDHWGARRVGRLTQRTMIELAGLTDEGGKYDFLNGTLYRADEIGMSYTFEIRDDVSSFGIPEVNAFQISERLNNLADPSSPHYDMAWRKIVNEISIPDEKHVNFTLRTPFVRPEALLKVAYSDPDENGQPEQNGIYVMTAQDKDITTFELNPRYERIPNRQHPVVIEQEFPDASTAVDELIAGNIDVVDRVPAADIPRLKAVKKIEIRPYLIPSVHMLIPKIRGELAKDLNFRSGLSHAIDREMLVRDVLCGGDEVGGCEVVSGPFPLGTEENDQISYGYDLKVRPLPFNTQLGLVLIQLSLRAQPPVRPEPIPTPNLVIAHPDNSFAANAAGAIARGWSEVGIKTSTRKLAKGETFPPDDDWDFLYLEVMSEEPLADALKMIGPHGFAKKVSAPIEQTLRNLSYTQTWQGTCSTLRRLHRQVAVDLSIIPLWQMKEHYAYRTIVRDIGRELIHLYQNIGRWRVDLDEEGESK